MKLTRLAPLVAVLALVGCAPSPTTAGVAEGQPISVAQVNDLKTGCPAIKATDQTALTVLAQEKFWRGLARTHNVSFTDGEVKAAVTQLGYGEVLTGQPGCLPALVGEVSQVLLGGRISQAQFDAYLSTFTVDINPRYGEWVKDRLAVTGSGSISIPASAGKG